MRLLLKASAWYIHTNTLTVWENLCPKGSSEFPTSGPLKDAVDARFGDFESMKKEFGAMTVGVQGSGWGWLGLNAKTGKIIRILVFLSSAMLQVNLRPCQDLFFHVRMYSSLSEFVHLCQDVFFPMRMYTSL